MNPAPAVKDGDHVRVVIEGVIFGKGSGRDFHIDDRTGGHYVDTTVSVVKSVEKIAKPIAVGDTLTKAEFGAFDWDHGTVVTDQDSDVYVFVEMYGEDGQEAWVDRQGMEWSTRMLSSMASFEAFKVIHLP